MNRSWSVIVPLIGGLPLAMRNVFKSDPECVMSYSPFQNNDKHFIAYLRKNGWSGKYHVLDHVEASCIPDISLTEPSLLVDVIGTVCPCAGLSSLSVTAAADNPINEWMYTSAEYILSKQRPKIFWGENAPRLATDKGKPVADRLQIIGAANGYSFLIYQTESRLHGNPQIRPRTFYFFFRTDVFPVMPILEELPLEECKYEDLISEVELSDSDPMNIPTNSNIPSNSPYYQFLYQHIGATDHAQFVKILCPDDVKNACNLITKCIIYAREHRDGFDYLINWFSEHGYVAAAKRMSQVKAKFADNKGAWLHGETISRNALPSLVAALPTTLIHPTEDRYLTFRECLTLMKMPEDFCLATENPGNDLNHICQNVIVKTAGLMCEQMDGWLNGEGTRIPASYAVQVNKGRFSRTFVRKSTEKNIDGFF